MRKVLILLATLVLSAACSTKAPDIEKQIDEPYPIYGNVFLETAARIKNTAFSVVSLLIDKYRM